VKLQDLADRVEKEATKTAIALRFVEWFTDRGVMYEQNMKTIDKHLGKLALGSHPQHRNPYENPVRIAAWEEDSSSSNLLAAVSAGNAMNAGYTYGSTVTTATGQNS
jgi:hypothetical protein